MQPLTADEGLVRPLDAAERYFWLLGHLDPVNVGAVAEVDRLLDAQALREALDRVQRRHRLLRVRISTAGGELVFTESTTEIPLETRHEAASWTSVLAEELDRPFDTGDGPCVRCVLVPTGSDAAVVLFIAHHAVADGLGVVRVVQEMLRSVAGLPLPAALDDPPGIHTLFPAELAAPRAVVTVASAVRTERAGQDRPQDMGFHHRRSTGPRRSRVDRLVLDPAALEQLRLKARAAGATVHGALAAAMLKAFASRSQPGQDRVICLATPTDLRRRVEPPLDADAVMLAVGMLCTPYTVRAGDDQLARAITEQTRREVDRGESHLFYRFARAAQFPPTDEGIASFDAAFASAPQNVAVSNLGVVDDADDPPWIRSIGSILGTSSNQPAFLTAASYRGSLVLHLTSDEGRLEAGTAEAILSALSDRL